MQTEPILVLGALEPWVTTLLVAFFLIVSVTMILIVLIQRPQGGGLSGAFGAGGGGGGAGQTAFGTKTGDVLTWATIGIFIMFLLLSIVLNFATRPPEAADPTPQIVAPGTPRETVDDQAADEESAADDDAVADDATTEEAPAENTDEDGESETPAPGDG